MNGHRRPFMSITRDCVPVIQNFGFTDYAALLLIEIKYFLYKCSLTFVNLKNLLFLLLAFCPVCVSERNTPAVPTPTLSHSDHSMGNTF